MISLRSVELTGFFSHPDTKYTLPERGLVLVTGANGSGKSAAFLEALSFGIWGHTLRGTDPWAGTNGRLLLELRDSTRIERTQTKSVRGAVTLTLSGGKTKVFENASKAQREIEALLGEWDVWRRSSVFSSADAAHFSGSTDAERKRLLEQILGIDRFDTALESCRSDLRAVQMNILKTETRAKVVTERIALAEQNIRDAEARVEAAKRAALVGGDIPARKAKLSAQLAKLGAARQEVASELSALHARSRALSLAVGVAAANASSASKTLARFTEGACPTCGEKLAEARWKALQADAARATVTAKKSAEAAAEEEESLRAAIEDLSEEKEGLDARLQTLSQEVSAVTLAEATFKAAIGADTDSIVRSKALLHEHQAALQVVAEDAAKLAREKVLLAETDKLLGTKGLRVWILQRALAGFEAAVNSWLVQLVDNVQVRMTCADNAAVKFEVEGLGAGLGYKACSGGERRRLDVALVLGLAALAGGSVARSGTLFFDEVADSLDVEGLARMGAVLHHLAADRCVVLISHNQELVASLRPARHYHVVDGAVQVA